MTDQSPTTASLETPADAGKGKEGVVSYWLACLALADKEEIGWRKAADKAVSRFRDEDQLENGAVQGRTLGTRFNILASNVRILQSAIYNSPPVPDIRERFKSGTKAAQAAAETLERAVSFTIDAYNLDGILQLACKDMLLPGRAVDRVVYEPQIMGGPGQEQVAWERVCFKHVQWKDFRRGPGAVWDDVTWIAFRHYPTKEEAEAKLGKLPDDIELGVIDGAPDNMADKKDGPEKDVLKRLLVWEIWDKSKRQIIWIAPAHKLAPLKTENDTLELEEFFPIPEPLYATKQADTLIPIEDYRLYRDQAEELDKITARISKIISAMKIRGVYDPSLPEIGKIMDAPDGELVPAEAAATYAMAQGLDKAIWLMPLKDLAAVLQSLYQQRNEIKQTIYELTGISDILRGTTNPSETLGAQEIKAQSGTISISDRQRAMAAYARGLIRLTAEIISSHFQPETIWTMTGMKLPSAVEKQQQMAQMQQQQSAGSVPPGPGMGAPAPAPAGQVPPVTQPGQPPMQQGQPGMAA